MRAVALGSALLATAAMASPAVRETLFVASTGSLVALDPVTLEPRGEIPIAKASAVAAELGAVWSLDGSTLRAHSFDGNLLAELALPLEEAPASEVNVGLSVLPDAVLVAVATEVFVVSHAGDPLAEATLTAPAVAADSDPIRGRFWLATRKSALALDANGVVRQTLTLSASEKPTDLSVSKESGAIWVALRSAIKRFAADGTLTLTSTLVAEKIAEDGAGGAWVASGSRLTRVNAIGEVIAQAPTFARPSAITGLEANPADGSVYALTLKDTHHVGPAGESLGAFSPGDPDHSPRGAASGWVDLVPPTISWVSPLPDADACVASRQPSLVVQYADAGTGVLEPSLAFSTLAGPLETSCASSVTSATCTPVSPLDEGPVTAIATVRDRATVSNLSAPAVVRFVVDVTPPAIALSPAEPLPPPLTNQRELSFAGTLSEPALFTVNGAVIPVSMEGVWTVGPVTLEGGPNTFHLEVVDCAGNAGALDFVVVLDMTPPPPADPNVVSCSESVGGLSDCRGASAEPGATVILTNLRTGASITTVVDAGGDWFAILEAEPGDPVSVRLRDAAGNESESTSTAVPDAPGEPLPPDPRFVATDLDPSVPTELYSAVEFLWEGSPPIQTNVVGTIEPRRIVVIRGVVRGRDGAAIPGVRVHAKNFPELGETRSRADGGYDLASHGGGEVVLRLEKLGFLTVDRHISTHWRDYFSAPDVVMIPMDPAATVIELAPDTGMQVARGSVSSDVDGVRRPTFLFSPGTLATLRDSDGNEEFLPAATVHLTEFSVGNTGLAAMPAELPQTSQFTFAFHAGIEESGSASHVIFDRPVIGLVENFLSFPTGLSVPSASYDPDLAAWIPEPDGLVIQIAGVTNGAADLVVDESGNPADELTLASLGITLQERETLSTLYSIGQTLFRVPTGRFSQLDWNFPTGGGGPPEMPAPTPRSPPSDPCPSGGSLIECQSQTLGESIGITGTPWSLNYRSDRVPARTALRTLDVSLSGASISPDLLRIDLEVEVAGQTIAQSFSPQTNLQTVASDFDAEGRVVRSQSATLAAVNMVYRPDGLLESTTKGEFPDARTVSMTYDALRELASVTDPLGRTSSFERDLAGRVTRQVLPDGREILTSYDSNGNVLSVTPPSRPEHRFAWTEVDLEQSYDPPDVAGATPGITNYEYDLDRRLILAIRPDGATVELSYAAAGGKLSEIAHAATTVSYAYDPVTGHLSAMSESSGSSLAYEYDGSLVLSESMFGPVGGQVSRAYDSDFRVREERVNGVEPITVLYDGDSLPEQVGDLLLSRNPATGLLDGTMLGSVATARTTNAFAEPVAESAHVGAAEVLAFGYDRDALGRITELRETIGGVETPRAFTYDSAGRLTDVRVGGIDVAHWTYDGNSNRIAATTVAGTVTAEYDDQDRLLRYGDATFTYTANGELATRTDPSGTTSYGYDAVGNLRHVELSDGRAIDYLIDARNRRVGKKVDGVLVQAWLYRDQLEPVAELDGNGDVVSRFVYATKGHSPDYMLRDGRTYRILSDHLGSPRIVIDVDSGAVVQEMRFDEWGVVTLDTNPGWQPFGFAGGLLDLDTGLVRFGARDYAAAEGRWTAKDPLKFGAGTNFYGYVVQDPINNFDPSGLDDEPATTPPPWWQDFLDAEERHRAEREYRSLCDEIREGGDDYCDSHPFDPAEWGVEPEPEAPADSPADSCSAGPNPEPTPKGGCKIVCKDGAGTVIENRTFPGKTSVQCTALKNAKQRVYRRIDPSITCKSLVGL